MPFGSEIKRGLERDCKQESESRSLLTRIPILDRLSGSGISRGTMIELSGVSSSGHFAVALAVMAAATGAGESAALVDPGNHLDPQGAEAAGIDLSRLLWVRPPRLKEALMSAEMILSAGFSLVVLDLGMQRPPSFPNAVWIRLARAARAHNGVLLVIHPVPLCGTAADTLVMAHSARPVWVGSGRAPRVLAGLSVGLTAHRRRGKRGEISGALFLPVQGGIDGFSADCLSLRS